VFTKVGETEQASVLVDRKAVLRQIFASLEAIEAPEIDVRRMAVRLGVDFAILFPLCQRLDNGNLQVANA
jgi:hypothetical protein